MTDTPLSSTSTAPSPHDVPDVTGLLVGILGGTGPQGSGLARRLGMAGQKVMIGSRDAARADGIAAEIGHGVRGGDNASVARESDVVVVAVPWDGHRAILEELRDELDGKIVIDCVNPLGFDKQGAYALDVPEGSAAQQAAAVLTGSRVVAAFNHVSAVLLNDESVDRFETDILVVGDDRDATDIAQGLASRINGFRGVYAGRLRNAHQVEALTANLISVNRRYKAHSGVRVTDV